MTDERRKMLTEALGECWHEWEIESPISGWIICKNCKKYPEQVGGEENRTFATPNDFFALWNWAKEQEWWVEFVLDAIKSFWIGRSQADYASFSAWLIDPVRFPELLAEFLEGRNGQSQM